MASILFLYKRALPIANCSTPRIMQEDEGMQIDTKFWSWFKKSARGRGAGAGYVRSQTNHWPTPVNSFEREVANLIAAPKLEMGEYDLDDAFWRVRIQRHLFRVYVLNQTKHRSWTVIRATQSCRFHLRMGRVTVLCFIGFTVSALFLRRLAVGMQPTRKARSSTMPRLVPHGSGCLGSSASW